MSDARDRSTSLDIEILGEGVFHEVGRPDLVVTTPDLVAVSGSFGTYGTGPLQWNGHLVRRIPGDPGLNRIGLYERFSLRCLHVVPSRWPVTCLAFDRGATRLAVGTGR